MFHGPRQYGQWCTWLAVLTGRTSPNKAHISTVPPTLTRARVHWRAQLVLAASSGSAPALQVLKI